MQKLLITFLFSFSILLFLSCEEKTEDSESITSGLYCYHVIDDTTGKVIDSLFTFEQLFRQVNGDSLILVNDFFSFFISGHGKLFQVFGDLQVELIFNPFVPPTTFYNYSGGSWKLEYSSIAIDTTIILFDSIRVEHCNILRKREWLDVGGFWRSKLYGLDKNNKIVYFHENLICPRNPKFNESHDYYVLAKYLPKKNLTGEEVDLWHLKNSPEMISKFEIEFYSEDFLNSQIYK